MFILRWFLSKTVREATTTRRHVERLLRAQRDLLSPAAVQAVQAAIQDLRQAVTAGADKARLRHKWRI